MRHGHHRCVGCETQGRPGRSGRPDLRHSRWGNRRRGTRRKGATAALERRGVPTLPSDEVSSAATAGPARAPSPSPAEVPGALRAAVRAGRDSGRAQVRRQAIEPMTGPADGGDGSGAKHPAGDADHDDCHDDRRNDRRRWRAARSAREDRVAASPMCERRNGPRHRRSDDAAREALRIRRRSGPRGCRAAAPCRRGCR